MPAGLGERGHDRGIGRMHGAGQEAHTALRLEFQVHADPVTRHCDHDHVMGVGQREARPSAGCQYRSAGRPAAARARLTAERQFPRLGTDTVGKNPAKHHMGNLVPVAVGRVGERRSPVSFSGAKYRQFARAEGSFRGVEPPDVGDTGSGRPGLSCHARRSPAPQRSWPACSRWPARQG